MSTKPQETQSVDLRKFRITVGDMDTDGFHYEIELWSPTPEAAISRAQSIINWMSEDAGVGFPLHNPPDAKLITHRLRFNKGCAFKHSKVQEMLF